MQTSSETLSNQSGSGTRKRVFSGVQPSGDPQLGNYLGAFKGWVDRQDEKENFFCIVDLHAITVEQNPEELRRQTRELAATLFACGIDPDKSTLFIQSHVTAHAEACWILNCVTPIGWLERMTQFKDKSTGRESVSTGLLDYPVLMAGDILLYSADEVPVGEDQKQHVELARDIAQRFNRIHGELFVVPEPVIAEVGGRIMGLNDPTVKMSKSYAHIRGHAVRLMDEPKEIQRSIMRAVTDSGKDIRFSSDPEHAGVNNLLGMYKVMTDKTESEVEADFTDARGYGDLKKRVAEVIIEGLAPIQKRYYELMDDVAELDRLLAVSADHAREIAEPKLQEMKQAVGFILPDQSRSR
jgi:tryptophanyl-tRNA synthetase